MHIDQVMGSALSQATSAQIADRGIVVLSSGLQVLYMSGRAAEIVKSLQQAETGTAIPGIVPTVIEDFCMGMLQALSTQPHGSSGISCEIRRLAGHPERPILLRGFALQNERGVERSHVVIIMEERSGRC